MLNLERLCQLLKVGPPLLSGLIDVLDGVETLQEFMKLVREFLPEHEDDFRRAPHNIERIQNFVTLFSQRYFPLEEGMVDEDDMGLFVSHIPIPRCGISFDDYHELAAWCDGMKMLMGLVSSPFIDFGDGARVPLLEELGQILGTRLARRLPQDGLEPAELHKFLDGTPYQAVALMADLLHRTTDCIFLEIDYETDLYSLDWSVENVEWLAQEWPRAQRIWNEIHELEQKLEENPRQVMNAILNEIEMRANDLDAPRGRPLVELFGTNGQVVNEPMQAYAYRYWCGCEKDLATGRFIQNCSGAFCQVDVGDALREVAAEEGIRVAVRTRRTNRQERRQTEEEEGYWAIRDPDWDDEDEDVEG